MTPAQRRVFHALAELEASTGWPAPLDVVAARAGLASRSTVMVHTDNLIRLGKVEHSPYRRGGYRIKAPA